jgi:aquacobalamin reductase/NAD(P)H-flavin reductase
MQSVACNISSIKKLNNSLYRIFLNPTQSVSYRAGQYISIVMGENDKRHFSIANRPSADQIELHISAPAENSYTMQVIEKMQNEGRVEIELGCGEAYLREDSKRPIILMAGGTGFPYVKSIVEQIVYLQLDNPVYLFWGVKEHSHFYFENEVITWAEQHNNIHYHPVVELPEALWQGHQGYVHQAVLNEFDDLSVFDIYLVGPFEMVKIAQQAFVEQGALADRIFGDAFAFI